MSPSLVSACGWTLARTLILCLLAWPLIVGIERWMRGLSDVRRPFAFVLLLAPFLFPELLVGYAYRSAAMSSANDAEWLCAGLLFIRIVPVGVVTLLASPRALVSASAIYCRWILLTANPRSLHEWQQLASCYWYGPVRRAAPALCLMSLVAFQEFELAALLQTASWTDWFITAQRGGLDRAEMLKHSLLPLVMQLPLLAMTVCWFAWRNVPQHESNEEVSQVITRSTCAAVMIYLGLALTCGCLIPTGVMAWNLPGGLMLLVRQPMQWMGLGRQVLIAMTISICAGMTAWIVGSTWIVPMRRSLTSTLIRQGLLLPGLIGSLLLSLATVVLFQRPWLRPFYDTPLPWMMALFVWLLPRAVLLRLWVSRITKTEGVHLAELLVDRLSVNSNRSVATNEIDSSSPVPYMRPNLRSNALLFRLRDQPRLLAMGLLCYWAYLDLSTAYMLAPSEMDSGLVRLYNFMHFGRSAALSAEAFVFFGTPILATYLTVRFIRVITELRDARVCRHRP